MKRISIYVNSEGVAPSGYYRILQYVKERDDVVVHSLIPNKIYSWWHSKHRSSSLPFKILLYLLIYIRTSIQLLKDWITLDNAYVIISKYVIPHYMFLPHSFLLKRIALNNVLIWDFDDNIAASHSISNTEFQILAKYSRHIIVISDFLKKTVPEQYRHKVMLLPTTDGDIQKLHIENTLKLRAEIFCECITLVWIATGGNLVYLNNIIPYLDSAAHDIQSMWNKKMILKVVCNRSLVATPQHLIIENIKWSRNVAVDTMLSSHIGIMPLIDNAITRGKGGFKLIQYLSAGLPVIASEVGYNKNVVSPDCGFLIGKNDNSNEWKNAIITICNSWPSYQSYMMNAKKRYDDCFSYVANKFVWDNLLNQQ